MIVPWLAGDALLADIQAANQRPNELHLWWLGQSGFLVAWQGRHLLLDPYLSDSLTEKYAATDKPHLRMTKLAIESRRLDFIDVVTSSHNHTDHLDADTLIPLLEVNANLSIVVAAANQTFAAERLRVPINRLASLDDGQSIEVAGFTIHAIPSAHEEVERDEQERCRYLGYVLRCGPWTIYHSGDTVLYDGLVERLREWSIDLALLPINGRAPERRVAGNLWGHEAAALAKEIAAGCVVPCHYEMFEFNTATPDAFVAECERLGQPYQILRCGERMSRTANVQPRRG